MLPPSGSSSGFPRSWWPRQFPTPDVIIYFREGKSLCKLPTGRAGYSRKWSRGFLLGNDNSTHKTGFTSFRVEQPFCSHTKMHSPWVSDLLPMASGSSNVNAENHPGCHSQRVGAVGLSVKQSTSPWEPRVCSDSELPERKATCKDEEPGRNFWAALPPYPGRGLPEPGVRTDTNTPEALPMVPIYLKCQGSEDRPSLHVYFLWPWDIDCAELDSFGPFVAKSQKPLADKSCFGRPDTESGSFWAVLAESRARSGAWVLLGLGRTPALRGAQELCGENAQGPSCSDVTRLRF